MADERKFNFDDGEAYEDFMGGWSRLVGEDFLRWLAPPAGARWIDVGCGNGAFTELLLAQCAPAQVLGVDPSPEQIAYAQQRPAPSGGRVALDYRVGDAMALPAADASFDAAVMALVIFFVPDPARATAEMARVVRPGGSVSTYAWDLLGGGFPYAPVQEELAALGVPTQWPPSAEASRLEQLHALWTGAGLVDVETCAFTVQQHFDDFEAFWRTAQKGPRLAPGLGGLPAPARDELKARVRARLVGPDGRVSCRARANAVRGRVPG